MTKDLDAAGRRKTFDLKHPRSMFEKLEWEYGLFLTMEDKGDLRSRFAAFNAASTAWHLPEWLWPAMSESWRLEQGWHKQDNMREDMTAQCPELLYCQQIGNGGKHFLLARSNDPRVKTRVLHRVILDTKNLGRANRTRNLPPRLEVGIDGEMLEVRDVLATVVNFWDGKLTSWGLSRFPF